MIILYLLSNEGNNSNMFRIESEEKLSVNNIRKGVRTIALENPIRCFKNQFIALAFGPHSGSPASVKDRNEYSIDFGHFCNVKEQNKPIVFNNYPNKGAAFSFVVEQSSKGIFSLFDKINIVLPTGQNNQATVITTGKGQISSTGKIKEQTLMDSSSFTVTPQNRFEDRDNMLRESSIAEDYWKHIINEIKQQEAKIAEEQTDKIKSSVIESIQTKIGNKTIIFITILIFF